MELQIAIMKNAAELETTQPFVIDSFLWGTESIPRTYGYLGYVPDDGFYLKMLNQFAYFQTYLRRSKV